MLLILNLPLVGLWIKMIAVPYHFLYPAILAFCCIGIFNLTNSVFEIYMLAVFGLLGCVRKLGCEPAPLLLGFILGPMLEENLRRTLLVAMVAPTIRAKRQEAFQE